MTDRPWSQTFTGRQFFYDDIASNEIVIEDIAHALALFNRYGGHSRFPYSVAQHSVLVADYLWTNTGDPYLALDGLMHDAAEAYVGDMRWMLKKLCPEFQTMEAQVDKLVRTTFKKYGLLDKELPRTKFVDQSILLDEKAQVMSLPPARWEPHETNYKPLGVRIDEMLWQTAEKKFLEAWGGLTALIASRERGRLLANDLHVV